MQFPNFAETIEFIRLRQQMGAILIPALPEFKFVRVGTEQREVVEVDEADKQLLEKLGAGAVEVSSSELDIQEGFLTYGGRKVVAYIRDQRTQINEYSKTSNYRFHL